MSVLAEKIAREHRLVGDEDGSVWCEGEGEVFEPDDAARHVAEVVEAAARADERARIAAELRARGLNVMAARVASGGIS